MDTKGLGNPDQVCERVGFHLLHHLGPVYLDGLFADPEVPGSLFV